MTPAEYVKVAPPEPFNVQLNPMHSEAREWVDYREDKWDRRSLE